VRRLILADVHAVLPALEAVLADAGRVEQIVCLGDLVGYGPHPAQCVARLRALGALAVLGNHDQEVLSEPQLPPPAERDGHQMWLRWTYDQLAAEGRAYLAELPLRRALTLCDRPAAAVHAAGSGPSLHPAMPDAVFQQAFADVPGEVVLFGHYHRRLERQVAGRSYVGIKAVGQARDHDPWAGYAIEQDGVLVHHEVRYDLESVARDVQAIGLPVAFCARWLRFLRTGWDDEWSRPYEG
jgi:predicted phosphodiesterase